MKNKLKTLLITGDSLSYNRFSYDDTPRENASDCHIGMDSWSFKLRKSFISSARGFLFGDELNIEEATVKGLGKDLKDVDSIFGDRVVTVAPVNGKVHIRIFSDTEKIVLYLQRRKNNYCRFTVTVDGVRSNDKIDTYGRTEENLGYSLITLELPCGRSSSAHEIIFEDFESTEFSPLVTVAGASTEPRYAHVTGQGSRTAKFLLYHFEERVASFSPDALVLILGGNDFVYFSAEEYRSYLEEFFKKMSERFPACKLLTVTIPPSAKPAYPIKGLVFSTDEEYNAALEPYNSALRELSSLYGADCINTANLFGSLSPDIWRHDEVHFSKVGNDILFETVKKSLGI